jgi:radical SAM protein with 4Fe4S-binding SPASM domain
MGLQSLLKQFIYQSDTSDQKPVIFHYEWNREGEKSRIHLRLDPDGKGTLIVNANRIYHLNPTATLMAQFALAEQPARSAVRALRSAYKVSNEQAQADYANFSVELNEIIRPDGACPICDLDVELNDPFSDRPAVPYRMDLALTYRCNNDCPHCYNVSTRDDPELTTEQWMQIIDQLWALGVPHIVFTGGEPTLRADLPELIAHAEGNGQITGMNTNGRRLSDPAYVETLVNAGLDHVQITLESHDPQIHDQMVARKGAWKQTVKGIQNALDTRLYVMTNTTMLENNAATLSQTLDFLAELGVPTVGLNALIYSGRGATVGTGIKEEALPALMDLASSKTKHNHQKLIWYTPTQYCHFDPVQMNLGVKGCTAALYNMCIEPDGGVLPCQSYYRQVGNILKDNWQSIWEHDLCVWLRDRQYVPEGCNSCTLLQECGGGCPLRLESLQNLPQFVPVSALSVPTSLQP